MCARELNKHNGTPRPFVDKRDFGQQEALYIGTEWKQKHKSRPNNKNKRIEKELQ